MAMGDPGAFITPDDLGHDLAQIIGMHWANEHIVHPGLPREQQLPGMIGDHHHAQVA